jgi:serine/threonine-protein kinase
VAEDFAVFHREEHPAEPSLTGRNRNGGSQLDFARTSMSLSPGSRLGPYEIVSPLGAGGMGEVYRARDTRLHREVAIKVLPASFSQDADRLRRFEQEARAASALNHPNILTIHDFGSEGAAPYVVSELLEGETLREKLGGGRIPVRKALDYASQIARGLAAAHEKGIVHRDLKPENLFVTKDGRVKILDFGLAKLTHPERGAGSLSEVLTAALGTEPGVVMGTAGYMSPEQVRGQPADHRSDIFSFGAVLYEMLTGKRAFGGDTAVETMSAILRDDPPEPSRAVSEVSVPLDRIVRRCLEKSPAERFQSASDLAYAIDETLTVSAAARAAAAAPLSRPRPAYRRIALAFVLVAALGALIAFDVGGIRKQLRGGAAPQSIRSLVVLPLENLSRDPEQEYFADGMTDALISNLARIRALRVISRTSAMRFKGARKSAPEIGRELDVDGIIEGSVLRSGERVRISAQLVHASTDTHLWAREYERDVRDVLALQSEVARAVADEVRAQVTAQERAGLSRVSAVDPEAHEAYLKGRFQWNKRTREGAQKALDYFQRAIEKSPGWAPAYAGLADTYMVLYSYQFMEPDEGKRLAKAAALKALELDDSLGEAHASLGVLYLDELDWDAAEREFRRALELNPGYATAHQFYGEYLSDRGRFEEAIRELKAAERLDPLSLIVRSHGGRTLYHARQYDRAIEQLRGVLAENADFSVANVYLGMAYLQKHMFGEAITTLEKYATLSKTSESLGFLGHAYGVAGRRAAALQILERLNALPKTADFSPFAIALVYTGLGEQDRALDWLDRAVRERSIGVGGIGSDPIFDPLRSNSRFAELLRRIGLSP